MSDINFESNKISKKCSERFLKTEKKIEVNPIPNFDKKISTSITSLNLKKSTNLKSTKTLSDNDKDYYCKLQNIYKHKMGKSYSGIIFNKQRLRSKCTLQYIYN